MEGEFVEMGKLIGAGTCLYWYGRCCSRCWSCSWKFSIWSLKNPNAAAGQTWVTMFIGIAFAEALGIFSFLVALLLMYAM